MGEASYSGLVFWCVESTGVNWWEKSIKGILQIIPKQDLYLKQLKVTEIIKKELFLILILGIIISNVNIPNMKC